MIIGEEMRIITYEEYALALELLEDYDNRKVKPPKYLYKAIETFEMDVIMKDINEPEG
ncbi:MAG TPA: hypothetical protein VKR58_06200 [Aquella sp.]|nr:hypothetical protein [Aquella sp.]